MSGMFCMGVRDSRCYLESFVLVLETRGVIRKVLLPKETHGHGYHLDFELGDGSRD